MERPCIGGHIVRSWPQFTSNVEAAALSCGCIVSMGGLIVPSSKQRTAPHGRCLQQTTIVCPPRTVKHTSRLPSVKFRVTRSSVCFFVSFAFLESSDIEESEALHHLVDALCCFPVGHEAVCVTPARNAVLTSSISSSRPSRTPWTTGHLRWTM